MGVVAVSNTNNRIGLYGLMGLVGIAVVMAIIIKPSLGANILVIAIFTNISDLLTKQGYPGIIKPLVAVVAVALVVRYLYAGQVPIGHSKTAKVEYFLLAYFMAVIASFLVASDKNRAMSDITDLGKDIDHYLLHPVCLAALSNMETDKLVNADYNHHALSVERLSTCYQ